MDTIAVMTIPSGAKITLKSEKVDGKYVISTNLPVTLKLSVDIENAMYGNCASRQLVVKVAKVELFN